MSSEQKPTRPFAIRLSEAAPGEAQGEARRAPGPAVQGSSLSDADTKALLDRLPPLEAEASDVQPFALRPGSLPAPRPGKTVEEPFPPRGATTSGAPRPDSAPLTIARRAPEGDVPLAPNVTVSFSQPMVDLASHAELATASIPVKLTPQPAGEWRWLGTQTLVFQPSVRMPMATRYDVEVPAGTRSVNGNALKAAERWSFSTPAPTITQSYPKDRASSNPLLFVEFDQAIDAAAVLATTTLTAGGRAFPLRLATSEEMAADKTVSDLAARAEKGRWLAFRASELLPGSSRAVVKVGPGTPSSEGPKTTAQPQQWTFDTPKPFAVKKSSCGDRRGCLVGATWSIEFSNPVGRDHFREEDVRIEPPLPGVNMDVYGETLVINGVAKPHTSYRVTLPAALQDEYGQTLGRDVTVEFQVAGAEPMFGAQMGQLAVLDPAARSRCLVFTTNVPSLRVRVNAVSPSDWTAYQQVGYGRNAKVPGTEIYNDTIAVKGPADEIVETPIDLAPHLKGGKGQVVVQVEPVGVVPKNRFGQVRSWVQATGIGLDALSDGEQLLAWASSLADGKPLKGVTVSLGQATATTDEQGMARLPLSETPAELLVARLGNDVAILPMSLYSWSGSGWRRMPQSDRIAWYVADDRQLYRPGEEVKIKGWLRTIGAGPKGDVTGPATSSKEITFHLQDSRGNGVLDGRAPVNEFGGFDLSLKLPPNMNLGSARLNLETVGSQTSHSIRVEEFRRPEFEVKTEASQGPYFVGNDAVVTASASYYAGGPLPNADTRWEVTTSRGSFTPPNRGEYTFGTWVPWWLHEYTGGDRRSESFQGRTDGSGKHQLRIEFGDELGAHPTNVHVEASVQDVNRQSWSASSELLVHPSSVYVGLKTSRYFVQRGQPIDVDLIVADLDGAAVAGRPVSVTAERLEWKRQGRDWKEVGVDAQTCTVTSSADASHCSFKTPEGGQYRITARVTDAEGRRNETEITRWVSGGRLRPQQNVEQENVTLVPDKQFYKPGDEAEILVVPPFANAEAVVTLQRSGLLRTERVAIKGESHTLHIKIEEGWTPNVHLRVNLVGAATRTDDEGKPMTGVAPRPAFASGELNLQIPPADRTLHLRVTPAVKSLEPGGRTHVAVALDDATGRPVAGGEVALFVVDEAVLSLTGYSIANPMPFFYAEREPGVTSTHLRGYIQLARPETMRSQVEVLAEAAPVMAPSRMAGAVPPPPSPMAMKAAAPGGGAPAPAIKARVDFNPLALFAGSVRTDAKGQATVDLNVPDNLTRYRIMAVAAAPDPRMFGSAENTVTARLPLMVRPSPPRFLNFGDKAEVPVTVQNQTDRALTVDVALRATNVDVAGGNGRRLSIPANDRAEVRFPVTTVRPGRARFQVAVASGSWSDAATFDFPVWTPATTEAFATYGQIDAGAVQQKVSAPPDAFKEFGGLRITTSSTALQALTDAVVYLAEYPFSCAEQLSSRILGIAAVRDVLSAFGAEGLPPQKDLEAAVQRDLDQLSSMQNGDGGFPLWRRGDESWPYLTVHAMHALVRARDKGFKVAPGTLQQAGSAVRDIERRIPKWYGEDARNTLIAYALYVRKLNGDVDAARARALLAKAGTANLSFEAMGWLLGVMSGDAASATELTTLRQHLNNQVAETTAAAHFAVNYKDGAYLLFQSNRRADAVILESLIGDQRANPLIPKLVEGLLAHRTAGHWANTQENVFVLLALDRYFRTYEKVTPDFVARVWLGDGFAGEHAFRGRTTERAQIEVPMQALASVGPQASLVLAKDGPGRLYYRLGLQYAPTNLDLKPLDRGFVVERTYQAVDAKEDVRQDADGTWHVKAGARVRVKLTMVAPGRRTHVALVDPMPAGFEALNPSLKTTGSIPLAPPDSVTTVGASGLGGPRNPGWWWFWRRPWFEHQNLRDERVEAFASLLWEGVWSYEYVARATTPGVFIVPPTRAEEMYAPETFGRAGTARVIVEAR